ncbi:MAG: transporter substrate-binding domain-containing protein [Chthoniobacteraceae bacterium]
MVFCPSADSFAQQPAPPVLSSSPFPSEDPPPVQFTPQERAWLVAHPNLSLGLDPRWPPFSVLDSKQHMEGVDPDMLGLIGRSMGVKFVPSVTNNWAETFALVQKGEVDVVSGIAPSPSREKLLFFTRPYVDFPVAVITRSDAPFSISMSQLIQKRIAVPKDYITTEMLLADYPQAEVIQTSTSQEAFMLVAKGGADATIENLAAASYLIKTHGLTNLKIAGLTNYRFQLCLGVPKDRPLLFSALSKALDTVGDARMHRIVDRWVGLEDVTRISWTKVCMIIGIIVGLGGLVATVLIVRQRGLASELAYRKDMEARLLHLNEEKNQIINMVAHDLNNPLAVITLKCRLWLMENEHSLETARTYFREIEDSAAQMSHFISSFLNIKAIEEGAHRVTLQPLRIVPILEQAIARHDDLAQQKGIQLQVENQLATDCSISANADALQRVFANLISNAIKFTPTSKKVLVKAMLMQGDVQVSVHDEGPGIPYEEQAQLFKKFTRLSTQPTAGESSHGLGLAIVKELVMAMRGEVWCESTPGKGAAFAVRFPKLVAN